jgi:hypothetical protein
MIDNISPLNGSTSDAHQAPDHRDDHIETVAELLNEARQVIVSSDTATCSAMRRAAELIAAARARGASQRQIAVSVGKSAAWVNRLLKWRLGDYHDSTPFGPQAKTSRQRAGRSGAPERQRVEIPGGSRDQLVKILGMLGSEHAGERDNAARKAEELRKEFDLTWDQLIIPANRSRSRS